MPDTVLHHAKQPKASDHGVQRAATTVGGRGTSTTADIAATLAKAPPVVAQGRLSRTLASAPRVVAQLKVMPSLGRAVIQLGGNESKPARPQARPPRRAPTLPAPQGNAQPVHVIEAVPLANVGAPVADPAPAPRPQLYPERRLANMAPDRRAALVEREGGGAHRDLDYLLSRLDEVEEENGQAVEGDPAEWLVNDMRPSLPRADFGAEILRNVPSIVRDAEREGYNVRNTAVLRALGSVASQFTSVGYETQLGSRQANYGTMQGGATGSAVLDGKRK